MNGIDPQGLTFETNWNFFWSWVLGGGPRHRHYGPYNTETQEMERGAGAAKLRAKFYGGHCKSITNVPYSSPSAFEDTILHPFGTPFQVGGFAGATATNNGNGTVTFMIPNDAGTHSFFYHVLHNRHSATGPMSTIHQYFTWTEQIPSGCGCS